MGGYKNKATSMERECERLLSNLEKAQDEVIQMASLKKDDFTALISLKEDMRVAAETAREFFLFHGFFLS